MKALLDLAERASQGAVQSHDIAQRQGIPEPYLNQLLTTLRKASLVTSRRGPGGGHQLARPASAITLADVFTSLEGQVATERTGWSARATPRQAHCVSLADVWEDATRGVMDSLGRVTLEDLLERERTRAPGYSI